MRALHLPALQSDVALRTQHEVVAPQRPLGLATLARYVELFVWVSMVRTCMLRSWKQAKKARCSGVRPCATCEEKGANCTYDTQYLRGRPPTPPSSTPGAQSGDHQVEDHAERRGISTSLDPCEHPQSLSRSSPELDATEINGQYVDRTSGLSFLQRARYRLKRHSAPDPEHLTQSDQPLTAAGDKPLLGSTLDGFASQPAILPSIPDSTQATELLDLYFEVCVATYKPLHRPTVDGWYRNVTENISLGLPITKGLGNARVSTLLSVFAVATFHRQKSRGYSDDVSSLSDSDSFFRYAIALTDTETGLPHLESAQARLLQVFYLLMTSRMNRSWFIFGNLLQIISALGMHRRDRKNILSASSSRDYIHGQCRRRTFWSAYILDKYVGVVMGRPRHFHDKDIDQEYPDRVNDDNMTPSGRMMGENEDTDDCHLDGFIWNIKLARLVGEISDGLYSIAPSSEASRVSEARVLADKLKEWQDSLPPLLKATPTNLVRGFRRQGVALRLAYKHAVVHLHRPFLLSRSNGDKDSSSISDFRQESVRLCISAARDALRSIDALAQEGPLFHAFWWTHYITFCALTVTYVWNMQRNSDLDGIDRESLMALADRCQIHLANATATNSPSRRYSIILEELRGDTIAPRPTDAQMSTHDSNPGLSQAAYAYNTSSEVVAGSHSFQAGAMSGTELTGAVSDMFYDPFMDWQTSDWLDLDASVSVYLTKS